MPGRVPDLRRAALVILGRMRGAGATGSTSVRFAAALLLLAALSAPAALAAPAGGEARTHPSVATLEEHRVLRTLGIPRLEDVARVPVFKTGFERDEDLAGFYSTPQTPATRHEVRRGGAHGGERAHVAWLTGDTSAEPVDGPNHRGYPTIQLQRTAAGACSTPCLVEFWARVDGVELGYGEWWSLATLSADGSDAWSRVITVNFGWEGWLHLFHVPDHGVGERALQRADAFPQGRWVRITTWLDLDPEHGAAAAWQDGRLMSAAHVRGGDGTLDQMHFGLYAPPSVTRGVVRNDDIAVYRLRRRG